MKRKILCSLPMLLFAGLLFNCDPLDPIEPVDPVDPQPEKSIVVTINEVCCNSNAEWVEILNLSDTTVNIGDWRIVYTSPTANRDMTLGSVAAETMLAEGEYYLFDKSANSLSGTVDMTHNVKLMLVSAESDTLSVFDRNRDVEIDTKHPSVGSYARFIGDDNSVRWAVTITPTKGAANIETPVPEVVQHNGIWIKSADFTALTTDQMARLASYGITNLFVNEAVLTSNYMTEEAFRAKVDLAVAAGLKIHIWFKCFNNGSWINPIDTQKQQFNQSYFDELIARAVKYVGYGNIAGIHLDYVRYPGTAYKYSYSIAVNGQAAITEFCRQISAATKAVKPDVILSAALMNETTQNAYYYGQSAQGMSRSIDVLIPMVYRYSWSGSATTDKGADWVFNTTKWFVTEVAKAGQKAEVWAGIMTYKPLAANDTSISNLSAAQLEIDCGLSLFNTSGNSSGATGVVLFRYGIVNYFDMSSIYYD